jgi:hypothetical protein
VIFSAHGVAPMVVDAVESSGEGVSHWWNPPWEIRPSHFRMSLLVWLTSET